MAEEDPAVEPATQEQAGAPTDSDVPTVGDGERASATDEKAISDEPRDVILVLDNSGSMKENDPGFLTIKAVREFVSRLEPEARLGMIIFDQDIQLAMPFTHITEASREQITAALERIDYQGQFTDSPAAIERAIYELKNNSREDARRFIIFMTDGIVDTGNANKDVEKTRWLREDLAPDAADSNIRIFGIAFTEAADFELIQTLAQKTEGEYYRALKPEDLPSVFERIQTLMREPPVEELPEPVTSAEAQEPAKLPQPMIINVPEQPTGAMNEQERVRSIIIIASASVLLLALVVIIVLLVRHNRRVRADEDTYVAEAYLNDIHGHTTQSSYRLGKKPAMIGRVVGKDTDHLDYIVIPDSTIGRRHALIEYKDFAYWIVDQGSINGTYVNDVQISSEVRLKHGDKIKLHKLEFEFIMPEMDEAGMTKLSNTVFAGQEGRAEDEATALKDYEERINTDEVDLYLGSSGDDGDDSTSEDEKETVVREEGEHQPMSGSEDETLASGREDTAETERIAPPDADGWDSSDDDETLMPGEFDFPDQDETLRSDTSDDSLEDFFDVTDKNGDDKDKDKRKDKRKDKGEDRD